MMNSTAKALVTAMKAEAKRLGFSLAGVTTPEPPPHLEVYAQWLANDHHAGMSYLSTDRARQRRANPRLILPECQTIIVLAASYHPNPHAHKTQRSQLQIASYALGDDYHDVLVDRMRQLVDFIQNQTGKLIRNRIYTDTGPLLERELAQRAGLGWIGKNTCLIHPQLGSYFLLGEVLLDIALPPDAAFTHDRCGKCTRCIDACPTGCILPNRTIDAERCISYWTIEAKAGIPFDMRPKIGNWFFGCDVCQQVCPWNHTFASPTDDPAFQVRPFLENPSLENILSLKPHNWREHLEGSPLLRAKRRGLLRNAAIVAGNTRHSDSIQILTNLLGEDEDPVIRAHTAWSLGNMDSPQAYHSLRNAREREPDASVIEEIDRALTALSTTSQLSSLD